MTQLTSDYRSNVVIFWGYFETFKNLLYHDKNRNLSNTIWILSESSGMQEWFLSFLKSFNTTVIITIQSSPEDETFKNYFLDITYERANDWCRKLFEKHRIKNSQPLTKLREINERFDFSWVNYVQTAVNVYINAFVNYNQKNCNRSKSANQLLLRTR